MSKLTIESVAKEINLLEHALKPDDFGLDRPSQRDFDKGRLWAWKLILEILVEEAKE